MTALDGAQDEKDTHDNNAAADKPNKSTRNKNKRLSLAILDKLELIHRDVSRLRPDLRNIVREEVKNVMRDEMVRQRGYQ